MVIFGADKIVWCKKRTHYFGREWILNRRIFDDSLNEKGTGLHRGHDRPDLDPGHGPDPSLMCVRGAKVFSKIGGQGGRGGGHLRLGRPFSCTDFCMFSRIFVVFAPCCMCISDGEWRGVEIDFFQRLVQGESFMVSLNVLSWGL